MTKERILIADDDENIQFAFRKAFEVKNFKVITANSGEEALKIALSAKLDLIFLDITMPKMTGLEVLKELKDRNVNIPIIVITGYGTMQTAIQAVQLGAYEYLSKPLDIDKLYIISERALQMVRLQNKIENLNLKLSGKISDDEIIGNNPKMQEVYKLIGSVANTPNSVNVLVQGESGTGKELVARAIHKNSQNPDKPFIGMNCSVLPGELLESELFGYEKGAFTDAKEKHTGKFEIAREGTIFLDEIGDMSMDLQKKLLRVIQEREFYRVGGNKLIELKARFIAATNKQLKNSIKKGEFREDLYYRLNVISITLPPLREKKDDILPLVNHFIHKIAPRLNKEIKSIDPEVFKFFKEYKFPGNVRELENLIERAIITTKDQVLRMPEFVQVKKSEEIIHDISFNTYILDKERARFTDAFEKKYIIELLKKANGKINIAAEIAQVNRRTIHRLILKHKVDKRLYL
jgi:DNA-binding NtrC family response regulator